ncbi:hypothetical protein [Asticcacaulis solisilvae]|uniref:hypothetical protein n=1 Tax=Asticcacaulis solisilvae TaxID=1217274 RepID=UPI003FD8936E
MRGAVLPDALLAAAVGMALSFTPSRTARNSAAVMAAVAVAVALIPLPGLSADIVFAGCWLSVAVIAASVHLKGGLNIIIAAVLAADAGLWQGLATHVSQGFVALGFALPVVLLVIPGRLLVRRGWGIGVKVVASWLIAIAALEFALNLVPTPGYKPDHMD